MYFIVKLAVTVTVIVVVAQIAKRFPALGGLITVMPITSLLVLFWIYSDTQTRSPAILTGFAKGALLGIFPTILFFLTVFLCFKRNCPVWLAITAGFAVWLLGAILHQWLLGVHR